MAWCNVHALDKNHSTLLRFVSQGGGAGVAHVLLENDTVDDARDDKDLTPLHVASQCGNARAACLPPRTWCEYLCAEQEGSDAATPTIGRVGTTNRRMMILIPYGSS